MDENTLKEREVQLIDIAFDEVDSRYYKKEEDPKLFVSKKTKRGPLEKDWKNNLKPLMCIYKVAHVEFRVWGLQTKAEQWIQKVCN